MKKRPFILIVLCFIAGILMTIYEINMHIAALFAFLGALAVFFFGKKLLPLTLVAVLAFFAGSFRMELAKNYRDEQIRQYGLRRMTLTMTVTDFSDEGRTTVVFADGGKTRKLYLYCENSQPLCPGDIIRGRVFLTEPHKSKTDMSDFSMYLASRNIHLCARANDIEIIGHKTDGIDGVVYNIRNYIGKVGNRFQADTKGLFNAMVLGDKRFISGEMSDSLQKAGLNHIAVVSGMHLSVIIAVQMMLLRKLFGKKRTGDVLSVIGAVFITLITGAGASVVRACVMCIIFCTAKLLYREKDSLITLMLTVMIMVGVNPYLLFNAGFVLSVVSVLGILLYGEKMQTLVHRYIGGAAGDAVAICLSAQLTLMLPVIYYFGIVTPYAVISNLLVTTFASALVVVSILFVAVSAIPIASAVVGFLVTFFAEAISVVCRFIQALPGASFETEALSFGFVAGWLFLLVLVHLCPKDRKKSLKLGILFSLVFFVGTCINCIKAPSVQMEFVSYGNENMAAAFFPDGEAVLIGCPDVADARAVADRYGCDRYDCVVLSESNYKKTVTLASENNVSAVVAYSGAFSKKEKSDIKKQLEKTEAELIFLSYDEVFYVNDIAVSYDVFEPTGYTGAVAKIEYKGKSVVFAENFSEEQLELLLKDNIFIHCNYLKVSRDDKNNEKYLEELTGGKVLKRENALTINLY